MKISELLSEQITPIGSTGSTVGQPGTVSQVSQAGSASSSSQPQTSSPNVKKLAATLKQNKVIDTDADVNNFLSAYQSQSTGKTLNPQQQASMAKLATALMKNKNLSTNLDLQLKTMSQQQPGQSTTTGNMS